PPDLAEDMRNSRYFNQYDPSSPNWVRRPAELPNTNLTNAFEPGSGTVAPPVEAAPTATTTTNAPANPTTTAANVTIQLNDTRVDPGDAVTVTVIANDPRGFNWIEWRGDNTDDTAL